MNITAKQGVISQLMDNEYVLLDTNTNQYFGLNEVGARFWQLVLEEQPLESIHSALLDEFDVSADQLRDDLNLLIGELESAELIIITDG